MAEPFLMKDGLGRESVDRMASALSTVYPKFDATSFKRDALRGLDKLELKARVTHLIDALAQRLPDDYPKAAKILRKLPSVWKGGNRDEALFSFAAWPLIDYTATHGLRHPEEALETLKTLTPIFSAEFAIRPFILEHAELTHRALAKWTAHADEHVRRLVSEGTRPRLPWGVQLKPSVADPSAGLALLEKLKDDASLYVRRSVANHLNDIAKDHPEVCVATCVRWSKGASEDRRWIIRHATRTLVKAGRPEVFPLLGYTADPVLKISPLQLDRKTMKLGDTICFDVELISTAKKTQRFVVDYAVHHRKANGETTPKVFKLRDVILKPGERVSIEKRHSIRPITTRKYYPGEHVIELLINGQPTERASFTLEM